MLPSLYVYETVKHYVDRGYKDINNSKQHCLIDSIYCYPNNKLWLALDNDLIKTDRPSFDSEIVILHKNNLSKYLDPDPMNQPINIKYYETFYNPKSNTVQFNPHRKFLFKTKCDFTIKVDRFIGTKPLEKTRINFNWFYDLSRHQMNFVISDNY